jgi:hypothetical protein
MALSDARFALARYFTGAKITLYNAVSLRHTNQRSGPSKFPIILMSFSVD